MSNMIETRILNNVYFEKRLLKYFNKYANEKMQA